MFFVISVFHEAVAILHLPREVNRERKIGLARLSIRAPLQGRGGSALGLINSLAITDSALTAERLQMDVIANNTANANTTHTPQGGPYKREDVYLAPAQMESNVPGGIANAGVQVAAVVQDNRPPRLVYDPTNPDANKQGYVAYPNVDPVTEMTDMMAAQRAYQANITVADTEKSMAMRAVDLGHI